MAALLRESVVVGWLRGSANEWRKCNARHVNRIEKIKVKEGVGVRKRREVSTCGDCVLARGRCVAMRSRTLPRDRKGEGLAAQGGRPRCFEWTVPL
jgi:hypothetical protein